MPFLLPNQQCHSTEGSHYITANHWTRQCRYSRMTTTTILRPLYRSTCISQHLQLRSGGFCWCKVLLPACPCWQQPVHSDYGEDAGVLLNSVIYTTSIPLHSTTSRTQLLLLHDKQGYTTKLLQANALPIFQQIVSKHRKELSPTKNYPIWPHPYLLHQLALEERTLHPLCQLGDSSTHVSILCINTLLQYRQHCPFPRGIQAPHLTWFNGPIRVHNTNSILTASIVFAQFTVTDRQTHITRHIQTHTQTLHL